MVALPSTCKPTAMSASASNSPATQPQHNCPLFDLPPELRNAIYDYVFHVSPQTTPVDMDLANQTAPQINLTLTCRRIYDEAVGPHNASYQRFWSENTFVISGKSTKKLTYDKKQITSSHVDAMNGIVVKELFKSTALEVFLELAEYLNQRPLV